MTDIAAAFPISLNSVSKHLRLLERTQLLERRVQGREQSRFEAQWKTPAVLGSASIHSRLERYLKEAQGMKAR